MRVPLDPFDRMYRDGADPWDFSGSDYEQARYEHTMRSLGRARYLRCFEPGCSIGVLTGLLAERCDRVVACDASVGAIETARTRLAGRSNVELHAAAVPEWWPNGLFDLIVLSEFGYYWDVEGLGLLIDRLFDSLAPGGELIAVHWLGESTDHLLHGTDVHQLLRARLGDSDLRHEETDKYLLERWSAVP